MKYKSSVHIKMTPEERAKQFLPFAALKGYEEALRAVELEMESKAEHQLEGYREDMLEYTVDELEAYDFGDQ